jgi:tRNA threonylcarbamoyladenosine biosynthesis protein TsaE
MALEILANTKAETQKTAQLLAREILKEKSGKKAVVLALVGELGGGKTTFIQGFARGLGIKEKVLSPTFLILKAFKIPSSRSQVSSTRGGSAFGGGFQFLYHIDCYRLKGVEDLKALDFKEIVGGPENIIIIEWADKIRRIIPKGAIWIKFKVLGEHTRQIVIKE